ncbi:hypothetical protein [Komarekiella delphini-convector]|uniref:hypothetical protein n=1 Tax=Komarekiella delphini-convector TaxID=3050158 RepID=UPI00177FF944|nr:hypothetical protein [Komarekiella delphini-convector]
MIHNPPFNNGSSQTAPADILARISEQHDSRLFSKVGNLSLASPKLDILIPEGQTGM